MAYHVWSVVTNRQSIWVKWIHTYRLKGRSFWDIKIPWDVSWSWRRLLQLREFLRPYIKSLLGDGSSIFFWHDTWLLDRPFSATVTARKIADMGSTGTTKVNDCLVNGQWVWPRDLTRAIPKIRDVAIRYSVNRCDKVVWCSHHGVFLDFKMNVVWQDIRVRKPRVSWYQLVWYSCCIPKHSFILWLAIRRKLMTQDSMQEWQPGGDLKCVFCGLQRDSVEHLFFIAISSTRF